MCTAFFRVSEAGEVGKNLPVQVNKIDREKPNRRILRLYVLHKQTFRAIPWGLDDRANNRQTKATLA
jgi:hypothetical protein